MLPKVIRALGPLVLGSVLSVSCSTMEIHKTNKEMTLFDFTTDKQQNHLWREISDTVREPGMSKAVFSIQKTRLFQRAVMFAMINPQPNGAGFAGVQTEMPDTAAIHAQDTGLKLLVRGQGQLKYWKVVLTDTDQIGAMKQYSYEQKFTIELDPKGGDMEIVELPFSEFKAFFRGREIEDAPPLDLAKTGAFGLQTFGGVYDNFKQQGTGSLEIDSISFY